MSAQLAAYPWKMRGKNYDWKIPIFHTDQIQIIGQSILIAHTYWLLIRGKENILTDKIMHVQTKFVKYQPPTTHDNGFAESCFDSSTYQRSSSIFSLFLLDIVILHKITHINSNKICNETEKIKKSHFKFATLSFHYPK